MLKYALFGNCQAAALRWYFQASERFSSKFEWMPTKESYLMSGPEVREFCSSRLPHLDLLFLHPHSNSRSEWHHHRTIEEYARKAGVRVVKFPPIHFSAYNPWEFNPRSSFLHGHSEDLVYCDVLLLNAVLSDLSMEEFEEYRIERKLVLRDHVRKSIKFSFDYFDSIEIGRECDVCVSHFFLKYYKKNRLMHNLNHPGALVMGQLARDLLSFVEMDASDITDFEIFPGHDSLIYECAAEEIGGGWDFEQTLLRKRYEIYRGLLSHALEEDIIALKKEADAHMGFLDVADGYFDKS